MRKAAVQGEIMDRWLEEFWGDLLSEEAPRIRAAFGRLTDPAERTATLDHLRKMATEEGWSPLQQEAARAALAVLAPDPDEGGTTP